MSDAIVVGIVADRFMEPDAQRGFILDGFPRTVAQAEALDMALDQKGLGLDAVLELKVDPKVLVDRIGRRAAETEAAGGTVRPDDRPDVLANRLAAYREQTEPVSRYYAPGPGASSRSTAWRRSTMCRPPSIGRLAWPTKAVRSPGLRR